MQGAAAVVKLYIANSAGGFYDGLSRAGTAKQNNIALAY